MSDEDAAIRAAEDKTILFAAQSVGVAHWPPLDTDRAIYRAGIVAGMRRAAEIADSTVRQPDWPDRYDNGCSAVENAILAAADKLEHEQEQR